MKYEPSIDRAQLIAAIRTAYGLTAQELTFIPVGYVAACYAVRCTSGERYFLKLWPDTRVGSAGGADREASLRLTRALHERGLYRRVPYPIPTQHGSLWAVFEKRMFAVFPFLRGQVAPPWPELSPPLRDELARVIATIHRATPALADVLPARETFAIRDEPDLLAGLSALEQIGPAARPGLRALRELVLPRRAEVLAQLDRLHRLQEVVRRLPGPFVLCHTDLGGDNLLIDDRDQLYVLDWDDATVAPPEHDLQTAVGAGLERFLEVYASAGGVGPWHVEHFAFYLLRRHLGDMTVRLHRMLTEHTTDLEDVDLLRGIETWGFAQWRALDQTLERVALALVAACGGGAGTSAPTPAGSTAPADSSSAATPRPATGAQPSAATPAAAGQPAAAAGTTVTFWIPWGQPERQKWLQKWGDAFHQKNPTQGFKMEFVGFGNMRQRWIAAHQAKQMPEVLDTTFDELGTAHLAGATESIYDVVKDLGGTNFFLER